MCGRTGFNPGDIPALVGRKAADMVKSPTTVDADVFLSDWYLEN